MLVLVPYTRGACWGNSRAQTGKRSKDDVLTSLGLPADPDALLAGHVATPG